MKAIISRLAVCFAIMIQSQAFSQSGDMANIKGGEFTPLYGTGEAVVIEDFKMDIYPVTNREFQQFLQKNPRWRRSEVKKLFAEESYLISWKSDLDYGSEKLANAPVTNVSWYAAKNYCECEGKRLAKWGLF